MKAAEAYRFRLDWFVSFTSVVEHGGFSAAAQALYRSQSRISTHVAELERALGVRLFDRTCTPVELTAEGRELLPHARGMLQHLQAASDEAARAARRVHGKVRLGACPSAAAHLFPFLFEQCAKRYPGVELVLREGTALELEAALLSGEVDLAVRPLLPVPSSDALTCRTLWREPLVAVLPAREPADGPLRLADLATRPLIAAGDNGARGNDHAAAALAFQRAGLTPEVVFRTNQSQTLIALVRAGTAVGVTNALAVLAANTEGVRIAPVEDEPRAHEVALWWRTDRTTTKPAEALRTLLAEAPLPDLSLT
ncbi:DNA-binding transcriptional regulator, LysR family [Saccharopolyspora kobensis]|uniref:DNA-binding transcriptional regulator, LysR family n=1 Tax=Saccharopolyspora kobensis TaxID=146035 RepID=A0A1H6DS66_9PSEU|nr:LysR family transcriptional regulator [Saccharopolyspora kobensis]SEG87904.1 DNA-binding transcriptional regulator, LysR family [Saccharopolyspora kobensis]SFE04308.1 DNA-binding transcriptional regulator, LysR family [Saccharopolyspora kobensis]